MFIVEFLAIFFNNFRYIFCHSDLDLWPKVTNFNRIWASVLKNHLAKTASKSVHPFGWNFVHQNSAGHTHTDRQTDRQTDTLTNCSENITPPRNRRGVKINKQPLNPYTHWTKSGLAILLLRIWIWFSIK